jgi:16S rRNA (cytosine1402-N4)-methyltransferase
MDNNEASHKSKKVSHMNADPVSLHIPVLLTEVLQYLDPKEGESYLDLTAGYGGHAREVLKRTRAPDKSTLVDRDSNAIRVLRDTFDPTTRILHDDFAHATQQLAEASERFDLILADLGISSPHIDQASRGFSLSQDGPLDMRMDQDQTLTAEGIVNGYSETQLVEILDKYGEEPKSRAIARAIVEARPIRTTTELASVVARQWRGRTKSKVHPATRTFQAIRIAVNDELDLLAHSLPQWINLLSPGGRICIISFQSLEDRLVKQILQDRSGERYDSDLRLLTKRPITPSQPELVHNPRSRSAKLRAAVKINNTN